MSKELKKLIDGFVTKVEIDESGNVTTPRFTTGIAGLDEMLDGGLPKGRLVTLATQEGGGKTTMAIQIGGHIIETYGKEVYYMDVEGGATTELISAMGYSMHLYDPVHNPDGKFKRLDLEFIQDFAAVMKALENNPDVGLIVLDSTTQIGNKLDYEDAELGLSNKAQAKHARMWSDASRPLGAVIKRSPDTAFFFIHQVRDNLSNIARVTIEAARGRALKHLTSVEIFGRVGKWIDVEGDEVTSRDKAAGAILNLTTNKNRLTAPYARVELPLFYGKGVSNLWAYRGWLETVNITDPNTGEVVRALEVKGGGYATLTLPSGTQSLRGKEAINAAISENIDEILQLVEQVGGLRTDIRQIEDNDFNRIKAAFEAEPEL